MTIEIVKLILTFVGIIAVMLVGAALIRPITNGVLKEVTTFNKREEKRGMELVGNIITTGIQAAMVLMGKNPNPNGGYTSYAKPNLSVIAGGKPKDDEDEDDGDE